MYSSSYAESDLVNSYMWDTAIVFIQNYSGDTNYANKYFANASLSNTGKVGDKVCNIHDMSSNYWEWTTEYSTNIGTVSSFICTIRGGISGFSAEHPTALRYYTGTTGSARGDAFRCGLYVN